MIFFGKDTNANYLIKLSSYISLLNSDQEKISGYRTNCAFEDGRLRE